MGDLDLEVVAVVDLPAAMVALDQTDPVELMVVAELLKNPVLVVECELFGQETPDCSHQLMFLNHP
jgi:hypothetical protein